MQIYHDIYMTLRARLSAEIRHALFGKAEAFAAAHLQATASAADPSRIRLWALPELGSRGKGDEAAKPPSPRRRPTPEREVGGRGGSL